MTDEQREYTELVNAGKLDPLSFLMTEMNRGTEQAYCTVNNGFLAHGRRLVPTAANRIRLRSPERCTEFGTDAMVGMLEWLGRQVGEKYSSEEYSQVSLVVGDVAAPRGGCLAGISGRRGHKSHTNGQDVDLVFLTAQLGRPSVVAFHNDMDATPNWWLAKKILTNPFACVKVIFLDRKHIAKLGKAAVKEGEGQLWSTYRRFFRHSPGHKNHFHVRVGDLPGSPGCSSDPHPELEVEDEDFDPDESLDFIFVPDQDLVKASMKRNAASSSAATATGEDSDVQK